MIETPQEWPPKETGLEARVETLSQENTTLRTQLRDLERVRAKDLDLRASYRRVLKDLTEDL